jgi:hypothetical protein
MNVTLYHLARATPVENRGLVTRLLDLPHAISFYRQDQTVVVNIIILSDIHDYRLIMPVKTDSMCRSSFYRGRARNTIEILSRIT